MDHFHYPLNGYDFCFIDGNHSYSGVLSDIVGVLPFITADAYLLFHDAWYRDVERAIDDGIALVGGLVDCGILTRYNKHITEGSDKVFAGLRLLRNTRKYSAEECQRLMEKAKGLCRVDGFEANSAEKNPSDQVLKRSNPPGLPTLKVVPF